jgi:hypothetical protein
MNISLARLTTAAAPQIAIEFAGFPSLEYNKLYHYTICIFGPDSGSVIRASSQTFAPTCRSDARWRAALSYQEVIPDATV